jgi:hypothetical protein
MCAAQLQPWRYAAPANKKRLRALHCIIALVAWANCADESFVTNTGGPPPKSGAHFAAFSATWAKMRRMLQNASRLGMTIFCRNDRPHMRPD